MATTMSDLPGDLVTDILSRVPLTSLRALRCTCKTWEALSNTHIFGKTDGGSTFLGFVVKDDKLCSMKLDLQAIPNDDNLVDRPSIKRLRMLKRAEVCEVLFWDGLLLCVIKDDIIGMRLTVWNPYLRQIRRIQPRDKFYLRDMYGVGYQNNNNNNNRNHKILRLFDVTKSSKLGPVSEIYDLNSNSWRVIDVNPGRCLITSGVSLKGNTYFLAQELLLERVVFVGRYFLLCFDFTAERFGTRLVLPFGASAGSIRTVVLSRARDEQLAVLHQPEDSNVMEIWITTKIEPDAASWQKFSRVKLRPFRFVIHTFFIDEEKKLALVSGFYIVRRTIHQRAYIIDEHGNIKEVNIGEAREPGNKLVFSSYSPSLVQLQINGRGKRKERDY